MTIRPYSFNILNTLQDAFEALQNIARERRNDVAEINGLKDKFMSGRKVGKVPLPATPAAATDTVGDFSFKADGTRMYILVDIAGVNTWMEIVLQPVT